MKVKLNSRIRFSLQIKRLLLYKNSNPSKSIEYMYGIIYSQELTQQYKGRLQDIDFKTVRVDFSNDTGVVTLENTYQGEIEKKIKIDDNQKFKIMCIPDLRDPMVIIKIHLENYSINELLNEQSSVSTWSNEVSVPAKIDRSILISPSAREILKFCK